MAGREARTAGPLREHARVQRLLFQDGQGEKLPNMPVVLSGGLAVDSTAGLLRWRRDLLVRSGCDLDPPARLLTGATARSFAAGWPSWWNVVCTNLTCTTSAATSRTPAR
jgi:hypothetical protein